MQQMAAAASSSSSTLTTRIGKNRTCTFIVTGFGPFHGVPSNPTTVLVQGLVEYLQGQHDDPTLLALASLTETVVLETSAEGARQEIDRLYDEQSKTRDTGDDDRGDNDENDEIITILLHLGVNYQGTNFQLEACAHNDASFRVADEKGYKPSGVSILGSECKVGKTLWTVLNVTSLVDDMNRLASSQGKVMISCNDDDGEEARSSSLLPATTPAVVSNDPGRFVCNYTYCYSLNKFQCYKQVGNSNNAARCLFVHVPPFDKVSEEEQFWFVAQLMKCLYDQIRGQQLVATINGMVAKS